MAVPTYAHSSTAATNSSNQIVLTKPASTAIGDVILVTTYTRTQYPASAPAGWTLALSATQSGAQPATRIFYRVCDGTEGSSFTFTATSFQGGLAFIGLVKGADPAQPIDVLATATAASARLTFSPPALTTTSYETLFVYALHLYSTSNIATVTPPGSVTVINSSGVNSTYVKYMATTTGPANPGLLAADNWTSSTSAYWSNASIAFRPTQTPNGPPTASISKNISNPSVGDTVVLSVNASDPENGALDYIWSLVSKPDNSAVTLSSTTASVSVTLDVAGAYSIQCTITDNANQSITVTDNFSVIERIRYKVTSGGGWSTALPKIALSNTWQSKSSISPAVTLNGYRYANTSFVGSLTPAIPSGTQAGDILYALASSNSVTVTPPVGWDLVGTVSQSTSHSRVWRKVAGVAESAPTFTSSGSSGWGIAIYSFRGVSMAAPEAQVAVGSTSLSRETTLGLLAAPNEGCTVLYVAGQTSTASSSLSAFNVAKTHVHIQTDPNGRFITGYEYRAPVGTFGRSMFWEKLGNCTVIGIVIKP